MFPITSVKTETVKTNHGQEKNLPQSTGSSCEATKTLFAQLFSNQEVEKRRAQEGKP